MVFNILLNLKQSSMCIAGKLERNKYNVELMTHIIKLWENNILRHFLNFRKKR